MVSSYIFSFLKNDVIIEKEFDKDVNKTKDDNILDCEETTALKFDEKDLR